MSQSWQLRLYKGISRAFHKPALAFVRPQWLARKLFNLNAIVSYERPGGLRVEPGVVGGVGGAWIACAGQDKHGVMLFVHGGAFVIGSVRSHQTLVARLAQASGLRAFSVDYRLAPEHPGPAAVEDALAVYRGLLAQGHAPEQIALCGDSAGGCIVLALLHAIGAGRLPMPGAVAVMSPVVDLTLQSPSLLENERIDPLIPRRWALAGMHAYLADGDATDPMMSPFFGAFEGACPVFFQVGQDEMLRDESVRMADVLRRQGVDVTLKIWPHVPHVWHLMSRWIPEAEAGIAELGRFLRDKIER